jgi:hypothetical protein
LPRANKHLEESALKTHRISPAHLAVLKAHEKKVGIAFAKQVDQLRKADGVAIPLSTDPNEIANVLFNWAHLFAVDLYTKQKRPKRIVSTQEERILFLRMGIFLGTAVRMHWRAATFINAARPSVPWIAGYDK